MNAVIKEASPKQIKLIHIAKWKLKITDEQYHDMLSGFTGIDGEPARSSKDLSFESAAGLLKIFEKCGFKFTRGKGKKKYDEFSHRGEDWATPAQLRKINATWMNKAREKNDEALNHFIKRIIGVEKIEYLKKDKVEKILKAIESL